MSVFIQHQINISLACVLSYYRLNNNFICILLFIFAIQRKFRVHNLCLIIPLYITRDSQINTYTGGHHHQVMCGVVVITRDVTSTERTCYDVGGEPCPVLHLSSRDPALFGEGSQSAHRIAHPSRSRYHTCVGHPSRLGFRTRLGQTLCDERWDTNTSQAQWFG
jgi:hypothetical protein